MEPTPARQHTVLTGRQEGWLVCTGSLSAEAVIRRLRVPWEEYDQMEHAPTSGGGQLSGLSFALLRTHSRPARAGAGAARRRP